MEACVLGLRQQHPHDLDTGRKMAARPFGHGARQYKYLCEVVMRTASTRALVRARGATNYRKHVVKNLAMKIESGVTLERQMMGRSKCLEEIKWRGHAPGGSMG